MMRQLLTVLIIAASLSSACASPFWPWDARDRKPKKQAKTHAVRKPHAANAKPTHPVSPAPRKAASAEEVNPGPQSDMEAAISGEAPRLRAEEAQQAPKAEAQSTLEADTARAIHEHAAALRATIDELSVELREAKQEREQLARELAEERAKNAAAQKQREARKVPFWLSHK